MTATVGLYLPPDRQTLALLASSLSKCGHLEVMPESLWAPKEGFNAFFRLAGDLVQRLGIPVVAHSVGLSTCAAHPRDHERQSRWLDRLAATHRALPFGWVTEHSGATSLYGENLSLPIAVPCTTHSRDLLRARLDELAGITGLAGIENSAFYALLDPPEVEPAFLDAALGGEHALLLDLHNLMVLEENHAFPAEEWLALAPLEAVIEVHIAGGSSSEALPVKRRFRLDSHDARVPERVWALLDAVLPRLPNLRAVTLERLEGTVAVGDVPGIEEDLERALRAVQVRPAPVSSRKPMLLPAASAMEHEAIDAVFAEVYRASDPAGVLGARVSELPSGPIRAAAERALSQPDALRLTALLVAQLRFSRVLQGSATAEAAFEADPVGFSQRFRAYHQAVPPSAFDASQEAVLWARLANI